MSGLKTEVVYEGQVVERGSRRAYEVTAKELYRLLAELEDAAAVTPDHQRAKFQKARVMLGEIAGEANRVAQRAERLEELDREPGQALTEAILEEVKG